MPKRTPYLAALLTLSLLSASVVGTPAHAAIESIGLSCPEGTAVAGPNKVRNGNFALGSVDFETDLPDVGPNRQPVDPKGGFSILTGPIEFAGGGIIGRPFPGNTSFDAPPSETYLYTNANPEQVNFEPFKPFTGVLWRQTITDLTPNTAYSFFAFFDNLLLRNDGNPTVELRVSAPGQSTPASSAPLIIPFEPDAWVPLQLGFRTGPADTSAVIEIRSSAININGDDVGITAISVRQCSPAIGVAKSVRSLDRNRDGSFDVSYEIVARNFSIAGGTILTDVQLVDDLSQTFTGSGGFSVLSLTSSSFSVNPAYNGAADTNLLAPGNRLAPDQIGTLRLVVRARPGAGPAGAGPFLNSVLGSAQSGSVRVNDFSANGGNPDPNGNRNPREADEDQPTPVFLRIPNVYLPLVRR
jgi:hypothetical protein